VATKTENAKSNEQDISHEFDGQIDFKEILAALQRQFKLILICLLVSLAVAAGYITVTPLRYTATASILIDPRQKMVVPDLLMQMMSFRENLILDSQIEIIQSDKLIRKAAARIGLLDKRKVDNTENEAYKDARLVNNSEEHITEEEMRDLRALEAFRSGLKVVRQGTTYVLKISYTSKYPRMSAARANLIADTYLDNEMEIQFEASKRTHAWLKEWAEKTRNELNVVEGEIKDYKTTQNIVETDWKDSISNQQLSDLNRSLTEARSETAQTKAKYDNIMRAISSGNPDAITSELMDNEVIETLRKKYVRLSQSATNVKRSRGVEDKSYQSLKRQMNDTRQLMLGEYRRIAKGYKNDYEIALSKQTALESELTDLTSNSLSDQQKHIELRELQLRAESIRNLYTKLLNNLNEQTEMQSAPFLQGRIINYAKIPRSASWPNKSKVMILAIVIGLIAGIALALLREYFDKFIWKIEELEQATLRTCLGMLPKLDLNKKKYESLLVGTDGRKGLPAGSPKFYTELFEEMTAGIESQIGVTTEIMRNIQLAVKNSPSEEGGKVISFVSANPGEGKSFTSCLLAKHLAKSGAKVLLIDCDFRRPTLTNLLLHNAKSGFYELASKMGESGGLDNLASVFNKTETKQLYFIPAKGVNTIVANLNLIASNKMQRLITHLKQEFDYVLIDLPPVVNTVDARAIAHVIDHFFFLVHWGKTDYHTVRGALSRAPEVHEKTSGALLTQVDTTIASRYGSYNYNSYYR
jgi:succinoglycan biosynthesis transport protein ExoP